MRRVSCYSALLLILFLGSARIHCKNEGTAVVHVHSNTDARSESLLKTKALQSRTFTQKRIHVLIISKIRTPTSPSLSSSPPHCTRTVVHVVMNADGPKIDEYERDKVRPERECTHMLANKITSREHIHG